MRILLDLQACQSASRFRGIGRFSLSLAQSIARNAGQHDVWLVLNGFMSDTIMPLRQAFDGLIPSERIVVFSVPGPLAEIEPSNLWRARAAELVREHAVAEVSPDFIHIASHFEGWFDDAVSSVGTFDPTILTAATFYDLIPFKHPETYFRSSFHQDWYLRKLEALKKVSLLFAISDYSRREAISTLGISPERIFNISAGVDGTFRELHVTDTQKVELFDRLGIFKPFLLYTGNLDPHKNLEGAIKGFAAIPFEVRQEHQFVIVSRMDESNRRRLLKLCKSHGLAKQDVLLTGYVSDSDLILLYNLCKAFVFASLYEGFGLPALEAMACGAPTIGSRSSSIPEVIGRKDALFDPMSTSSIAQAMYKVLADDQFRESLREHASVQKDRFSWDGSASRVIAAIEETFECRTIPMDATKPVTSESRYRVLLEKFPRFPSPFPLRKRI